MIGTASLTTVCIIDCEILKHNDRGWVEMVACWQRRNFGGNVMLICISTD